MAKRSEKYGERVTASRRAHLREERPPVDQLIENIIEILRIELIRQTEEQEVQPLAVARSYRERMIRPERIMPVGGRAECIAIHLKELGIRGKPNQDLIDRSITNTLLQRPSRRAIYEREPLYAVHWYPGDLPYLHIHADRIEPLPQNPSDVVQLSTLGTDGHSIGQARDFLKGDWFLKWSISHLHELGPFIDTHMTHRLYEDFAGNGFLHIPRLRDAVPLKDLVKQIRRLVARCGGIRKFIPTGSEQRERLPRVSRVVFRRNRKRKRGPVDWTPFIF